jgi:hypothetical protein
LEKRARKFYHNTLLLLVILFFCTSCQKKIENENSIPIPPVSDEYALHKVQEFCTQLNLDCSCSVASKEIVGDRLPNIHYREYDLIGYSRYDYSQVHLLLYGDDYFQDVKKVICQDKSLIKKGMKDRYALFLIRNKSKEIEEYANGPIYDFYSQKYSKSTQPKYGGKPIWYVVWPEFIPEEKAKDIFLSIAAKLRIPSDMFLEKIIKNKKEGVGDAIWVRKRNGYRYDGDAISISIMGASGEFVAYTKTYRGTPCSTEMKISKEQAIDMGWEKLRKYLPRKVRRMGKAGIDLYEVKAEPLIIQTSAFGHGGRPIVKIKGSKLAWVIKYTFTGGFINTVHKQPYEDWTKEEKEARDDFNDKVHDKARELGLPEELFEVRIDAATGEFIYESGVRPWYLRWLDDIFTATK